MNNRNRKTVNHWAELPYPGQRPDWSWRLIGDFVHRIDPVVDGWSDCVTNEDVDLSDRVFILAYGSNANPGKLRGIDAVMLQAEITDARAVWSTGRRRRDGTVVSTIVREPGHVEACPVLAVTPEDLLTVDGWEKPAYARVHFWGQCTLENGTSVTPEVYIGGSNRQPLMVDGSYFGLHSFDYFDMDERVPS